MNISILITLLWLFFAIGQVGFAVFSGEFRAILLSGQLVIALILLSANEIMEEGQ